MKLFQLFESKELVAELLWFQRYITDHNLETQMEIEDNKIVFRIGEKLIEWDVTEARRIRTEVLTDAEQSFNYAVDVINVRFELGELVIATNAMCSYWYARDVLKRRFELGEPAISKKAICSCWYAEYVIEGRFELGEPVISTDADCTQIYQNFLKTLK